MKRVKLKERCDTKGCTRRATVKHECLSCERLKAEIVYSVCGCVLHARDATDEIRKHALVKHPSNLVGAVAAALKGEDVFE